MSEKLAQLKQLGELLSAGVLTHAKAVVSYRRWTMNLEGCPSRSPPDRSGRSAHSYGSEGWGSSPAECAQVKGITGVGKAGAFRSVARGGLGRGQVADVHDFLGDSAAARQ
jgi:hypothetical protein